MGEVFAGRYELVDPIGRGGVGAVWRAWDQRRDRYVAAKVLQQSDAHALLRFVREQATRIDHPHVLAPVSWAADDDKVLFTMRLVHGGSLSHLIGDYGPLPPRLVGTLLDQLLSGLSAVHAEGVVHRDIKPANVLLEATGTGAPHVRLSDFGIAMRKGEARLTEPDYVVGTPGYFAPEQLLGAEPDFPADLYAVGLVALYLLSGRKPDANAIVERYRAMGTPTAPEGVPEPLWQVVAALLQPDPTARFRTATGARKALAAAVELLPETALDDDPVEIFDQIGALPEGFGVDGPLPPPAAGRGAGPAPYPHSHPAPGANPGLGPDPASHSERGAGPRPTPDSGQGPGPVPRSHAGQGPGSGLGPVAPAAAAPRLPSEAISPPAAPIPPATAPPAEREAHHAGPRAPEPAEREAQHRAAQPGAQPGAQHAAPPPAPQPLAHPAPQPAPLPAPHPAPQPAPLPAPHPASRPDPQPPAPRPVASRPRGRHAAPLPAHEPTTHTRTQADAPAALPLPNAETPSLPLPRQAAPARDAALAAAGDTHSAALATRPRRPGPPAKVVVPVLLLAALCFAFGLLALAAS